MSGPDKDPSSCSSGGGGGSDDEEEEDEVASSTAKRDDQSTERGEGEAKRVSVFRLRKAKKKVQSTWRRRGRKRRWKSSLVSSGGGCLGSWGGGVGGCCLSMRHPQTLDSSSRGESPPTSDPNSKEFTCDMLKVFIEKNDFYAADCNPHLDLDAK